ncbi:uncharacterized protein LOC115773953 [Archocentrus centrarchus]|uniref:uncharacterized protein LOC115773953 n=1 Tax=Archocentrus centrarchus TaxID=63155 RepID=UPI0011EA5217|nr:uncharacterized protein LOC115773953 [Archocentrus centrarchus]XP_030576774.1 uncharacterized protein LOC115773953 [Archocentrus centrarchus]XP_030576775.1 uncharacterized protein LOC115773953 [Archocentrus centrarchus]XP_030576776.1 uncharacterized protein LOC115773953 [Archocentrus centrarchus]XP_030576777.1 uncharacterized protein LOC115773953 [Archocentrus centrarchus]
MERRHLLKQLGWFGTRGLVCPLIVTAICVICMVIFAYSKFPHDSPSITDTGKTRMNHVRRSLPGTLNPFSSPDFIKNSLWLQYANFTAVSLTNYSCTFCMVARPLLMVIPVPDTSETCASDPHYPSHNYSCKFLCDIYYTNSDTSKIPEFCGHFFPSSDFTRPPTHFEPPQDVLIPSELNVTDCFISTYGTTDVGTVKANCKYLWDVCKRYNSVIDYALLHQTDYLTTVKITRDCMTCRCSEWVAKRPAVTPLQNPDQKVADVWWLCGDAKLRPVLPQTWKGTCIRVKLIQQTIIHPQVQSQLSSHQGRVKRSKDILNPDSKVYIDTIGVPQGVPDEYKAQNQIAAGFTSWLPFFGHVTENSKNTEWNKLHLLQPAEVCKFH